MRRVLCLVLSGLLAACSGGGEAPEVSRNAAALGFGENAFECLREAIYFEAKASHSEGQHAVADVIKNRQRDQRFPNTICGVIEDRCQFAYRCDGRPESFPDRVKFRNATRIAEEALARPAEDITGGAVFFHAQSMAPGWFGTLDRTGNFGGNIFYRG